MKEFKFNKVTGISSTKEGIMLEVDGEKVLLDWGIIDKVAEASEEHYHEEMMKDFKILVIMNSQKKMN
jgi:hypothetical protein